MMGKWLGKVLFWITWVAALAGAQTVWAKPRELVVLIPGTLNSIVPGSTRFSEIEGVIRTNPYFSAAVLEGIEAAGYATYVIRDLEVAATFEVNGDRIVRELGPWYRQHFPQRDVPITLLGHSAGGFYALHAAAQLPDLPIRRLIAVSTPWEGVELAQAVRDIPFLGSQLEARIEDFSDIFDLRGLPELLPERVRGFLARIGVPSRFPVYATGGSQPRDWTSPRDSRYLSPLLSFTSLWADGESDGLVSLSSALGNHTSWPLRRLRDLTVPLDHVEQMLDYRILKLLGQSQTEYIQGWQRKFYSDLVQLQ